MPWATISDFEEWLDIALTTYQTENTYSIIVSICRETKIVTFHTGGIAGTARLCFDRELFTFLSIHSYCFGNTIV